MRADRNGVPNHGEIAIAVRGEGLHVIAKIIHDIGELVARGGWWIRRRAAAIVTVTSKEHYYWEQDEESAVYLMNGRWSGPTHATPPFSGRLGGEERSPSALAEQKETRTDGVRIQLPGKQWGIALRGARCVTVMLFGWHSASCQYKVIHDGATLRPKTQRFNTSPEVSRRMTSRYDAIGRNGGKLNTVLRL